jgi:hypothetical protein
VTGYSETNCKHRALNACAEYDDFQCRAPCEPIVGP